MIFTIWFTAARGSRYEDMRDTFDRVHQSSHVPRLTRRFQARTTQTLKNHGTNQVDLRPVATYVFPIRNKVPARIVAAQISGTNAEFLSLIPRCFVEATPPNGRLTLSQGHSLLLTLADLSSSRLGCPDIAALLGASLTSRLEGTAVTRRSIGTLSAIENEVILEIRAMRASPGEGLNTSLLENPASTARHFILDSHGNAQLRLATIARELGVGMRTLERIFFDEYRQTMAECQLETRLAFSQTLLSIFPPTKISAVAAILGYNAVQDFNRFFKKHIHESPSEWSRKKRARIAREERVSLRD